MSCCRFDSQAFLLQDSKNEIDERVVNLSLATRKHRSEEGQLSDFQMSVCERLMLVFQGDTSKISAALECSKEAVEAYIKERNMAVPLQCLPIKVPDDYGQSRKKIKYYSMSNYNPRWLKKVLGSQMEQPFFMPCNHEQPCSDDGCTCVENGSFCTKHCFWGCLSRNFFRGTGDALTTPVRALKLFVQSQL